MFVGRNRPSKHDRVYPDLALAARFGTGAIFSGGGAGCNLGRASGVADAVLQRFGLFTAGAVSPFAEVAVTTHEFLPAEFRQTKREIL
jgi:hypothetical protein